VALNQENLIPLNERTKEEQREIATMGGIASGKARQEKATMKKTLEMLLNEKNNKGKTYRELTTLGLIKGAINGNASNYRTIVEVLGELIDNNTETPSISINIVDNSNLEKVMYEDNDTEDTTDNK
jgi:flagellar biosynthesis chaperone FliJ